MIINFSELNMPPSNLLIVPNEIYFISLVKDLPAKVKRREVVINNIIKLKMSHSFGETTYRGESFFI